LEIFVDSILLVLLRVLKIFRKETKEVRASVVQITLSDGWTAR
jgi:hypothetical protein